MGTPAPALTPAAQQILLNTQGDILNQGIPKKEEIFFFFQIQNAADFCKRLRGATPLFANCQQIQNLRNSIAAFNKAFGITLTSNTGEAGGEVALGGFPDQSGNAPVTMNHWVPAFATNIAFTKTGLSKVRLSY